MIVLLSLSSSSGLPEKNICGLVLVGAALPDVAGTGEALRVFFYDRRAGGAGVPVTVTTLKIGAFSMSVTRF
jgi:hypothetical protein